MNILGISGSLRTASANTTLLKAAAALAPRHIRLLVYSGIGSFLGKKLEESGIMTEPEISNAICGAVARFAEAISRE